MKLSCLNQGLIASLCLVSLSACGNMEMPGGVSLGATPISAQNLSRLQAEDYQSSRGLKFAQTALNQSTGGTGYCYQYVAQAIHQNIPAFLWGEHAYMAADQLAASPAFRELSVSQQELNVLPAGTVVVWNKGSSASGHISIADGRGNEISDHIAPQMLSHYGGGSYRVFLPIS